MDLSGQDQTESQSGREIREVAVHDGLVYAFTMIAFLGGIVIWDWMATRQEHKRGTGPSISRSDRDNQ